MKRNLILAAVVLVLAGCATRSREPVQVLSADVDTITVRWSSVEVSETAARRKAVLHCGARRVEEVDAQRTARRFGLIRSTTWRCVSV